MSSFQPELEGSCDPYHWTPELLHKLKEAIPRLLKGKRQILDFFRGAGVDERDLADLRRRVAVDRDSISKYEIAHTVLVRLNDGGDRTLGARRRVLHQVENWRTFDTCWETDRREAKVLVVEIKELRGSIDAAIRSNIERTTDRQLRQNEIEAEAKAKREREAQLIGIEGRLGRCFSMENASLRGKELERILNDYFRVEGLLIAEDFHVTGDDGEGVVEQIDGAVEINTDLYIVEMKLWSKPIGNNQTGMFLPKVYGRADAGGILIAHPCVTDAVIGFCKEAIVRGHTVLILTLLQFHQVLASREPLGPWLKDKLHLVRLYKNPVA